MRKSSVVRVTKMFNFEMAHALYGYDGPCKNIHGHSYQLSVTVIGNSVEDASNPKLGMVMDFSELKKLTNELIIQPFDHVLVLNANSPHKKMIKDNSMFEKVVFVNYQPTCENLLIDFAERFKKHFPNNVKLHHLCLKETANSFAEWYATDNE